MLGSIFSTALGWAGGNQLRLFAMLGLIISAAAFAAGIYLHIRGLHHEIDALQKERVQLTADKMVLEQNVQIAKDNLSTLTSANADNLVTIQNLLAERNRAQAAVAELAKSAAANKKTIDGLTSNLGTLRADPKNDGPVAPALRETVRQIQQSRSKK